MEGGDVLVMDAGQGRLGEKYGIGNMVPPWVMVAVMASTMPKQWNMGTWIIILSSVDRSMPSPMDLPSFTML